ncbi:cyclophane-forming radical SAM/SPASM peptide maturase YhhB [Sphingopyxis chilensis]
MSAARITSFLVKVASRCNLDCDYCYVYHHADQSWRRMPKLLGKEHQDAFARRLAEYAASVDLRRASVIYHGGEPLLAGVDYLVQFTRKIRSAAAGVEVDFGMQTNGLLLTDDALDKLQAEGIAVSLSMDGPREAHDLHRTTRRGRSSFDKVEAALERLKRRPEIFAGVIAVVDAATSPETLFSYFSGHGVPKVDFLLPDSHHDRPPPGRDRDPELYSRWMIEAFDVWLDRYPELPLRTFEALLDVAVGLPSGTDAFGFGDVSLLSIESDGTWHDLDVFKVAGEGATRLVGSVIDTSIEQLASSAAIAGHRRLLTKSGLSDTCRACEVVDVCGGGSVPHRFGAGGFDNPTVYCREMKALVSHVHRRLAGILVPVDPPADELPAFDIEAFELAETSAGIMAELHSDALDHDASDLAEALALLAAPGGEPLEIEAIRAVARRPGTVAWQRALRASHAGRAIHDVDGRPIAVDDKYAWTAISHLADRNLEIGQDDEWLRKPFGESIVFENGDIAAKGRTIIADALDIVEAWRPALARELRTICSAIQFVRDPSAHPDKIVSFSDNAVPGALYVSITQSGGLIDAYDLADSLIHEYRHQKLYLFERQYPTTQPGSLVFSPWREDLRPASGLLHAIFVFVELRRFWEHIRDHGPARLNNRAIAQLEDTEDNLWKAFETLRGCNLTRAGRALGDLLESKTRRLPLVA